MISTDSNTQKQKVKYSQTQLLLDSLRSPIESYLLADFVKINEDDYVLDIGCGNGFVALSLAEKFPQCRSVCGIELIYSHLQQAKNVQNKISNISEKPLDNLCWCNADVRDFPFQSNSFDVIVSNPPFYKANSGRQSPNTNKQTAHEEHNLNINDLFESVSALLKPDGRFYMVYPMNRMNDITIAVRNVNLILSERTNHLEVRKRSGGVTVMKFTHKV